MMRNRFIVPLLIAICVLSLIGNIISITNYNDSKRHYIFNVHTNLRNIVICFDNLQRAESETNIQYNNDQIGIMCLQLDSIHNDSMTRNEQSASFSFKDYADSIKRFFWNHSDQAEIQAFILENKDAMLMLMQELSANRELAYDEYSLIDVNPNYAISLNQIIKITNRFLDERYEEMRNLD